MILHISSFRDSLVATARRVLSPVSPPVLGATCTRHGRGACAAGGGAPTGATRSRLASLAIHVNCGGEMLARVP